MTQRTDTAFRLKRQLRPVRMCIACGARRPCDELIRFVYRGDTGVTLDLGRTGPGRGAHVCRRMTCVDTALKKRLFRRAFKRASATGGETRLRLEIETSLKGDLAEQGRVDSRSAFVS